MLQVRSREVTPSKLDRRLAAEVPDIGTSEATDPISNYEDALWLEQPDDDFDGISPEGWYGESRIPYGKIVA